MRDIKFRIYSKHDNKIIFPEELNFRNAFKEWNEVQRTEGLGVSTYDSLNDTLMQFTGLLDKNGKEVYEGDIIEMTHPYKNRKYIGEIIYSGCSFIAKNFCMTHFDNPNDFTEGLEYIEVIGNIHENNNLISH